MSMFVLIDCIHTLQHLGGQTVLRIQFSSMLLTNCCKGSVVASGFRMWKVAAMVSCGRNGSASVANVTIRRPASHMRSFSLKNSKNFVTI